MADINVRIGQSAVAGGTVDALTITLNPAIAPYNLMPVFFRSSGPNITTTPTANVNSSTAYTITKKGGEALVAGDIDGDHLMMLDLPNTRWELLNPASDVSDTIWKENAGVVTLQDITDTVMLGGNTNSAGVAPLGVYTEAGLIGLVMGDFGGPEWMMISHDAADGFVFLSTIDIKFNSTTKAETQAAGDNSLKLATTEYADRKTDKKITRNRQTASYTLVASDADKLVEMNVGSANNLTVPANVFTDGQQILISQYGAGQTTIVAGAGMTLRVNPGLLLSARYSMATIVFISATEAYVSGDLTA